MSEPSRRTVSLEAARVDGWLDRIGEESPSFNQLCAVVGRQYVAFSILAGVRIHSLTVDRRNIGATRVEFTLGDEETKHELVLTELQRRLCAALLEPEIGAEDSLSDAPDAAELHRFLGAKQVLLASLFGIELVDLHLGGGEPASVRLRAGVVEEDVRLDVFHEIVRARVRQELFALDSPPGFAIDVEVVDQVLEAEKHEDWNRVLELVGNWPGALAMLLRTQEGANLDAETKATLARTTIVLARAQLRMNDPNGAEDSLRLAVQLSLDTDAQGDVFLALGRYHLDRGQPGQAVGALRRSLSLGAAKADALPLLAQAFAERGRWVAAAVCASDAIQHGASAANVEPWLARAKEKLGAAWTEATALRGSSAVDAVPAE
ncbi:MAG: hypothetical protein R3A78_11240 [Polyangiales bacterium]|nr:hypothetical protein [Myxococcales bacterium]